MVAVDEGVFEVEKGMFQFPLSPGREYPALASDEARNTYWCVPHVKRWVKHVYQDVNLEMVEELYFYRVQ